jgi:8-oxo-dGTP diphosphatase
MIEKRKYSRIGVYGLASRDDTILLITQKNGPYAGKFDFPGGGIEFGETVEQTLRREFEEEINMYFQTMEILRNLTVTIEVPSIKGEDPYTFHQIGLIYRY